MLKVFVALHFSSRREASEVQIEEDDSSRDPDFLMKALVTDSAASQGEGSIPSCAEESSSP